MGSSQNSAFVLLLLLTFFLVDSNCGNSSFSFSPTCHSDDLSALYGFLNNLESAPHSWGNRTYGTASDCCKWEGITCGYQSPLIIRLELSGKRLIGKLSETLSGLVDLKILNLSSNYLTGSVPSQLFRFPNLLVLDLSGNHFSGALPADIYLPKIKMFDISDNYFFGVLNSMHISNFSTRLEFVDLSQNQFTGGIPVGFGNSTLLDNLSLGFNLFTGNLPEDLFRLQGLTRLDISNNMLSGTLNPNLSNLSSLIHLDVSSNIFSGEIPEIFHDLKKLKSFFAGSNMLSGHLPVSLTNSPSISSVGVNNNSLSGSISALNCSAMVSLSYLSLSTNNFVGPIPEDLSLCRRLQVLHLDQIRLNSQIPESFSAMKALSVLTVSNSSVYNLSSALSILQHCENLTQLIMTSNFANEFMPVDPSLRFDNVKVLVIANGRLTGSIPSWLIHSTNLHLLDLSWNRLSGDIPSWFNNLSFIFYLDLSNNSLHGQIPEGLTQLQGLAYENLQAKGPPMYGFPLFRRTHQFARPIKYKGIWSLRPTLDLSHNKLQGHIPIKFGKLRTLHVFDLSHNMLTGHIPSNLSSMSSLEVLDLSYNSLSGIIPPSLQLLSFLSQFNVSHNNLTGRVPTGGQFPTFPNSSFEGNSGLCNALLLMPSCDGEFEGMVPNNKVGGEEDDDDDDDELEKDPIFGVQFGIGVIVGFVVALVGLKIYGFSFCMEKEKEKKRNHVSIYDFNFHEI